MHRPNQDRQNLKFSCPYLFPFAHKSPNFYLILGLFEGLQGLKGPQRSSDQMFTYFNASAVSKSTKPEIFMSLSHSVLSQSGPPKSVGSGVVYHTSTGQYIGEATFFFFFFLFFGTRGKIGREKNWFCVFSGVVATTLILLFDRCCLFVFTILVMD